MLTDVGHSDTIRSPVTATAPTDPAPAPSFVLRDEVEGDRRYILSTWKRVEGEARGAIEGRRFGPWQERLMHDILSRHDTRVVIASPSGDETIGGWMVAAIDPSPCIYYLFVGLELRRLGLGRMLVGGLANRATLYANRPPRVLGPQGWQPPEWFARTIPRSWRFMERANYFPLDLVDSGASAAWRGR